METKKFTGFVLKVTDYKEKDKLLTMFTLEEGLITVNLRGVKNAKAKLKSFGLPFCFAEWIVVVMGHNYIVTTATMIDSFFDITQDIDKYVAGSVILNLDRELLRFPDNSSSELFVSSLKALRAVCYQDIEPKVVLCKLFFEVLEMNGFSFFNTNCSICGEAYEGSGFLNVDDGNITCRECRSLNSIELSNGVMSFLKLLKDDLDSFQSVQIDAGVVLNTLKVLKLNIEKRLPLNINLKQLNIN